MTTKLFYISNGSHQSVAFTIQNLQWKYNYCVLLGQYRHLRIIMSKIFNKFKLSQLVLCVTPKTMSNLNQKSESEIFHDAHEKL